MTLGIIKKCVKVFIRKFNSRGSVIVTSYGLMLFLFMIIQSCGDDTIGEPVHITGTIIDIEGNTYKTIKIGNQWWMAENLKVTTFRSGEKIKGIVSKEEWMNTTEPAFTIFNNAPSGPGLLYNYYAVEDVALIAPIGWHVATDEDWKILEEFIGMPAGEIDKTNWRGTDQGDQLKEETTNISGWIYDEGVWGNNTTGFTAIGGSCRVFNGEWGVPGLRHSGFWWTSTAQNGYSWFRSLDYKKSGIFRYQAPPQYGFSIRCVKN
jgi:uncharacterized protein (TIGR02145 family)